MAAGLCGPDTVMSYLHATGSQNANLLQTNDSGCQTCNRIFHPSGERQTNGKSTAVTRNPDNSGYLFTATRTAVAALSCCCSVVNSVLPHEKTRHLSLTNPRGALRHGKRAAYKGGRSVSTLATGDVFEL